MELLQKLFAGQQLLVPEAVRDEFAEKFDLPPFIETIRVPSDQRGISATLSGLGAGERDAIVLANETDSLLIIDDREARAKAKRIGIKTTGCLNVVKNAFIECHIVEGERDRIIREGSAVSYWPPETVQEVMQSKK